MKRTVNLLIITICLTSLFSCGGESNGIAEIIENWHKENGPRIYAKATTVNSVTFVKDVTAADSINFLLVRHNFIKGAQMQYEKAIKEIEASKKLRGKSQIKIDATDAQSVIEYNQRDVDRFNANIKRYSDEINSMIDAMEGNYSGSKWDEMWKSINRLKGMGNTIVSKMYKADVSTMDKGKGAAESSSEQSYYMLNLELTKLTYDGPFAESWLPKEDVSLESIHFDRIK